MKPTKLKPWYRKPVEFTQVDRANIEVARITAIAAGAAAQNADVKAVSAAQSAQQAQVTAQGAQSAVATKVGYEMLNKSILGLTSYGSNIGNNSVIDDVRIPVKSGYLSAAGEGSISQIIAGTNFVKIPVNKCNLTVYEGGQSTSFTMNHLYTSPNGQYWYWHDVAYDRWCAGYGTYFEDNGKYWVPTILFMCTMKGHYIYKNTGSQAIWWAMNGEGFAYPATLEGTSGYVRNTLCSIGAALPMRYRYIMQLRTDMTAIPTHGTSSSSDISNPVLKGYAKSYKVYPVEANTTGTASVACHARRETIGGIYNAISDCGGYHIFASSPGSGSDNIAGNNLEGAGTPTRTTVPIVNKYRNKIGEYFDNPNFIIGNTGEPIVMCEGGGGRIKPRRFTSHDQFNYVMNNELIGGSVGWYAAPDLVESSFTAQVYCSNRSSIIPDPFIILGSDSMSYGVTAALWWACLCYQASKIFNEPTDMATPITPNNIANALKGNYLDTPQTDLFKHFLYYRGKTDHMSDVKPFDLSTITAASVDVTSQYYVNIRLTFSSIVDNTRFVVGPYHD